MLMSNFQHRMLGCLCLRINEIHDRSLVLTDYSGVRIIDEIFHRRGMPMIPAGHSAAIIQALLNYCPLTVRSDNETVQVDLKTVSDCIVVDSGG